LLFPNHSKSTELIDPYYVFFFDNNFILIDGTANTMRRIAIAITITDPSTTANMIVQVVELSSPFFFSLLLQITKRTDIELDSIFNVGQESIDVL